MIRPTIYEVLRAKLGREPTHKELCDDVRRILALCAAIAWAYSAALHEPATDYELQAECLRRLPFNRPQSECDL